MGVTYRRFLVHPYHTPLCVHNFSIQWWKPHGKSSVPVQWGLSFPGIFCGSTWIHLAVQSQGTGSRSFIGTLKIFLFSREYLNKYWFNLLACNGKPPHPSTHTCLTRLLSLTSEGLVVTGNGKRLQRAGKRRLKAGRGMDRRTSRGQPGGGFPQGPAAVGKLGSYPAPQPSAWASARSTGFLGLLLLGCVCAVTAQSDCSWPHGL